MRISICIPAYEMHGVGAEMLERNIKSIKDQTFKDYEIIVTDDSNNNVLANLCDNYTLKYFKNPGEKGMARNTNFAIKQATGELIKILYQDDYFAHENALQVIVDNFKENDNWMITACSNNHSPYLSNENTLGSPSVLTFRNNSEPLLFNENYSWMLDLDLYLRLLKKFGEPKIIYDINVVIGLGRHQHTNHLSEQQKYGEYTSFKTNNQ